MAHPLQQYRQQNLEQSRVARIAGHAAESARSEQKAERPLMKAIAKREVSDKQTFATGGAVKPRLDHRARGGRTKGKTNVNVIIGMPDKQMPVAGAGMPLPPGAPPMAPGLAAPPPAGPGLPPMPPRSTGGRATFAKGGAVKSKDKGLGKVKLEGMKAGTQVQPSSGKNDLNELRTFPPITYARGGAVPKWLSGGSASGVGRLEKAEEYGKRK